MSVFRWPTPAGSTFQAEPGRSGHTAGPIFLGPGRKPGLGALPGGMGRRKCRFSAGDPSEVRCNGDDPVEKATKGDRAALATLLEQEGPAVRRIVEAELPERFRSLLSSDDVMQQTYADAFLGIERFVPRGEGAFRAWLTRLAKRNLVDAIRMLSAAKRGGDRRRVDAHALEESYAALYEVVQRTLSTPSRKVAGREARSALDDALAKLPQHYAQVVQMYDLEGRPIEEVADCVGRRVGATYMLRSRAHDRLGELMGSASRFFTAGG